MCQSSLRKAIQVSWLVHQYPKLYDWDSFEFIANILQRVDLEMSSPVILNITNTFIKYVFFYTIAVVKGIMFWQAKACMS